MNQPPFLTDEEIASATDPLTQGAARCRYIRKQYGVLVRPKPNGQPLVGRAEFEAAMMQKSRQQPHHPTGQVIRPDWANLRGFKK